MMHIVATLALSMAAAEGVAEEPEPLRVLLITGSHPFDPRLYHLFEGHENVEWDKKTQGKNPCQAFDEDFADGYDVVVLYDFEFAITDEQKQNFQDAFGNGRGLVIWHHALCSHPTWPGYREITGSQFFFEPQGDFRNSEYTGNVEMTYLPTDHPVSKGVEAFTVVEEPYKYVHKPEDAEVLLRADNEASDDIVAWATTHGDSRVTCVIPGHGGDIFVNPEFRKFWGNTLRWTAKRDVGE